MKTKTQANSRFQTAFSPLPTKGTQYRVSAKTVEDARELRKLIVEWKKATGDTAGELFWLRRANNADLIGYAVTEAAIALIEKLNAKRKERETPCNYSSAEPLKTQSSTLNSDVPRQMQIEELVKPKRTPRGSRTPRTNSR